MAKKQNKKSSRSPRIVNRKARHDYDILEVVECGIELTGTEVKSLREGRMKISEAYGRIRDGQVYLVGANISPYSNAAGSMQHEPDRDRRLLLHRRQIKKIESHVRQKGKTLIPTAVYFKRGWAKCELGLATGKRQYDKRRAIKEREQKRRVDRELAKRRRRGHRR